MTRRALPLRCLWLAILPALLEPGSVTAQTTTVWRCGPEGRSFSDRPCPAGQSSTLDTTRPAGDLRDARFRAGEQGRQADRLLAERLQREAAAQRLFSRLPEPAAVPVKAVAPPVAQRQRRAASSAGDGTWRATVPVSRPSKG
jgi:hypothetical protein